jgi:TRAP-type C4-dicarboxylate transport system permease small subunit
VKERYHILIVVTSLPTRLGRDTVFIADVAWAFFCLFMLRVSWVYLAKIWKYPSPSLSLGINEFYPQTILFIGYALMLIRLVQYYYQWYRDGAVGLPGMLVEDGDKPLTASEQQT